ncbi:HNH endonuclease family protein [Sorangium sp. So ce887]|uniref:HNH endonuclease family protein n=1 Tax=Sorangium sp. So ce887 TaxID=3133324 RepID=UPI003F6297C9
MRAKGWPSDDEFRAKFVRINLYRSKYDRAVLAALGEPWRPVHAEWLHTLGNLTLVGADYNSEMSNRPFEIKKPVLGQSKVYLNQCFEAEVLKTWSKDPIEARAKLLADLAIKVWPAPTNPQKDR